MPAPPRPAPELSTPRLRLLPCGGADVEFLLHHWTDPLVRRYLWDDAVLPRERVEDAVRASEVSFRERGFGLWIARDRVGGAEVGVCGLRRASWVDEPELVYSVIPARWGRGLASEAAAAVLAHAFDALRLARVLAATSPENLASVRTLERLGLLPEREGLLDGLPALFYAMARNDFREGPLHRPARGGSIGPRGGAAW